MAAARILVVDDEPGVLKLVSHVLTTSGYDVRSASNGKQALEIVNSGAPIDLVISDVEMPGIQGPDLLKFIRQASPFTALMLMSGWLPLSELPIGTPLLVKPFRLKDLIAAVEQTLAKAEKVRQDYLRASERARQLGADAQRTVQETKRVVRDVREARESRKKQRPKKSTGGF